MLDQSLNLPQRYTPQQRNKTLTLSKLFRINLRNGCFSGKITTTILPFPVLKGEISFFCLESLACRRLRRDLVMIFRTLNGLNGLKHKDFFNIRNSRTRGYARKIFLPR